VQQRINVNLAVLSCVGKFSFISH